MYIGGGPFQTGGLIDELTEDTGERSKARVGRSFHSRGTIVETSDCPEETNKPRKALSEGT